MKGELLIKERVVLSNRAFVDLSVFRLPQPLRGSAHTFKYRLAYVVDGRCVLRYDNEQGKGDHKHIDEIETPYEFTDLDTLQKDFWTDVDARRK